MRKSIVRIVITLILSGSFIFAFAQQDTGATGADSWFSEEVRKNLENIYMNMSLNELMEVEVVETASKRMEDLFEAPLSVTILRREDIVRSGAICIPEALRQVPGVIVRQTTSGNYDVHIRGFDDATTSFLMPLPTSTTLLVMIDNRPVYDYYSGGTFWESLPIGIQDVERIEVVRGPASALYGPNAMNGVIHIITRQSSLRQGFSHFSSLGTSHNGDYFANLLYSYDQSEKLQTSFSANLTQLSRTRDTYYSWEAMKWLDADALPSMMVWDDQDENVWSQKGVYRPEEDRALYKYGLNAFVKWAPLLYKQVRLSTGYQKSVSQKPFYNNFATPLSEYKFESWYIDLNTQWRSLLAQLSFQQGTQRSNFSWYDNRFAQINGRIEYDWQWRWLRLHPAIAMRVADYAGIMIAEPTGNPEVMDFGIPDESRRIRSTALSLFTELTPWQRLRLIWGLRVDGYNYNKKAAPGSELGATYRFNKNHLGRVIFSYATRSPFLVDTYYNSDIELVLRNPHNQRAFAARFMGNPDLDYMYNSTAEIGWRYQSRHNFDLDVTAFSSVLGNFIFLNELDHYIYDNEELHETVMMHELEFQNEGSIQAVQGGLTFAFDMKPSQTVSFGVFATVQHTTWNDSDEEEEDLTVPVFWDRGQGLIDMDTIGESTPDYWGGFHVDWQPLPHWNFHLNGGWIGKQTFHIDRNLVGGLPGLIGHVSREIGPSLDLNLRAEYQFNEETTLWISGKNLTGSYEAYPFTDPVDTEIMFGVLLQSLPEMMGVEH